MNPITITISESRLGRLFVKMTVTHDNGETVIGSALELKSRKVADQTRQVTEKIGQMFSEVLGDGTLKASYPLSTGKRANGIIK